MARPDRSLDSLSSSFRPYAFEWIARVTARGVAVVVVQTSRTLAEQEANLLAGTSGTRMSLHLPRRLRPNTLINAGVLLRAEDADKADAMDLAPYEQFNLHGPDKVNWDAFDPAWGIIGEEAERVGLRWGGRWRTPFDPGHGELALSNKAVLIAEERQRPWPNFRPTRVPA
jgi:D-alanyl-D-alanine carboxypeptidase